MVLAVLAPLVADATEPTVTPDRVTHYRACEELSLQCIEAIQFPEGTQSYYFRWKQCDQARRECVKHPVPSSAVEAIAARKAREAAAAEARKAEKAALAEAERRAREESVFPEFATAAEIAAYNATAAPDDQLACRPRQLTGSHRR